jgi:hypothetical protein
MGKSRQVWKFEVQPEGFIVSMPPNAEVLCVQMQRDLPYLWALADFDTDEVEDREFVCVGTGHPFYGEGRYIGTFQMDDKIFGILVWHVFERVGSNGS